MSSKQKAVANRLLAALPLKDYSRIVEDLEPMNLTSGQVLCEPGKPVSAAYFPSESVISMLSVVKDDRILEAALVGREGMVGAALAAGILPSVQLVVVQCSGPALKMAQRNSANKYSAAVRCAIKYCITPIPS